MAIIPGVSAAQAAASRLAVSLTDRRYARRLQYVTGHSEGGRLPDDIDWKSIADPAAMTAVYMPKRTLAELSAAAMAHGLDPATPAVAMANVTRPDEAIVVGTLADIATRVGEAASDGPVLVLIGRALETSAVVQEAMRGRPADAVAEPKPAPASKVA